MPANIIHILPDFIANQIAAGEVVQRPESVVKELVENALDADANQIAIFIKDAGKSLIHIVDNGKGMSKDDLAIATLRHSTSKIKDAHDLVGIKTFGFRGEALPSIASVALLEIKTKQKDAPHGWQLLSEPMKEPIIQQITADDGTQCFVRNLFYNVPARRKFLKSNVTEQKHIYDSVTKFALAHPDKRFIFYDNNALILDVKPEPLQQRIANTLRISNEEVNLLEANFSVNDIHINGFIGHPQTARKANAHQYFFLNNRSINSKYLSYAVFSAYEQMIDKHFKPFFLLNIQVDYEQVDVNVHPQKSEVKFEDEKLIFTCVKNAAVDALKLHNIVPELVNMSIPTNMPASIERVSINYGDKNDTILVDKITGEIYNPPKYSANKGSYSYGSSNYNSNHNSNYNNYSKISQALYGEPTQHDIDAATPTSTIPAIQPNDTYNLWQLHNKYILVETKDGLLVIDQHNAHERFLYENLINKIQNNNTASQALLFPVNTNVTNAQLLAINELTSELAAMGFDVSIDDSNLAITIAAIPANINITNIETDFTDIIDDYLQNNELKTSSKQERIAATVACKAAIKAGQKLSSEEMTIIVNNLLRCEHHHVCPHGRPIIYQSNIKEWDMHLGR